MDETDLRNAINDFLRNKVVFIRMLPDGSRDLHPDEEADDEDEAGFDPIDFKIEIDGPEFPTWVDGDSGEVGWQACLKFYDGINATYRVEGT